MKTKAEKIRMRDDALLKQESSLRRSRIGAIGFAIVIPLAAMAMAKNVPSSEHSQFWTSAVFFAITLACYYHAKIRHIESVKMYRDILGEHTNFPRKPESPQIYWDCPKCGENNLAEIDLCRGCGFQTE